jgi:hypothetical protein
MSKYIIRDNITDIRFLYALRVSGVGEYAMRHTLAKY